MKFSSPRNLTGCDTLNIVSFRFHAEWHDGKSEVSEVQTPATETQSEEQTDGGHSHGEVYHPTAHSPEVAAAEAQLKTDETKNAETDLNTLEPM